MLESLIVSGYEICGIITTPERLKNKISDFVDLRPLAEKFNIPIIEAIHIHKHSKFIKSVSPDIMIVYGWQRIIDSSILDVPRYGTVGFHASMLPKYRGSAPVNWAIINGEQQTGVTLMKLTGEVDAGPILCQRSFMIDFMDTCATVYDKSADLACQMIHILLNDIQNNTVIEIDNPSINFSVSRRRRPEDGEVDWNKSIIEIYNFIRGITRPYPGAFTIYNSKKIILWRSSPVPYDGIPPLDISKMSIVHDGLIFGCQDGNVLVFDYEYDDSYTCI